MRRRRKHYYVAPGEASADDPRSIVFVKNLNQLLLRKGWRQSDLAREAQKHLPKGREFGRHLISAYMTGKNLPTEINLRAMAKALGVEITDIIPADAAEFVGVEPTAVKVEMTAGGKARIYLDMELDTETAFKIIALVQEKRGAQ